MKFKIMLFILSILGLQNCYSTETTQFSNSGSLTISISSTKEMITVKQCCCSGKITEENLFVNFELKDQEGLKGIQEITLPLSDFQTASGDLKRAGDIIVSGVNLETKTYKNLVLDEAFAEKLASNYKIIKVRIKIHNNQTEGCTIL